MSARDDLEKFDRQWELHREWLAGWGSDGLLPQYVRNIRAGVLALVELPAEVRDRFLAEAHVTILNALSNVAWRLRSELVVRARREAEETLANLPEPAPVPQEGA